MIKIKLCMGSRCMMAGASTIHDVLEELQEEILVQYPEVEIQIDTTKCKKYCKEDSKIVPVVRINEEIIFNATTQVVMEKVMELVNQESQ